MRLLAHLSFALLATSSLLMATPIAAQETWPARAVRLVVPFPPGGGTDIVARALGQKLAVRFGKPVVIDNKPGASTIIGTETVTKAEPDGYTLLVSGSTSYTVNPALRANLPYDPAKDLAPIALVARAPLVFLVNANSPYKTLSDVVAAAKARPKTLNYYTYGAGSAPHLVGTLLEQAANISMQDVPYKGSSQALVALIGGEVQLGIDTVAAAAPQIRAGKLRALAIVGAMRSSQFPDIATVTELKYPAASFDGWYAIAAPARTPQAIVNKLVAEVSAVMADPDMQALIKAQAMEPVNVGPAAVRKIMDEEITRYRAHAWRAKIVVE